MSRVARAFTNKSLRLIILPTEQCNYRCTYCYEDFEIGRMKPETVLGLKSFIVSRASDLDHLELSWFGGEPLLARDIVCDVMRSAKEIGQAFGTIVHGGMTTNGHLLTRDTLCDLIELAVTQYQITFDGPQRFHDARRLAKGGRPTFMKIYSNLRDACELEHEFKLSLRVHLDAHNSEQISDLLDEIGDVATDSRVELCFERVKNLGKELRSDIVPLRQHQYNVVVEALQTECTKRGIRTANVLDDVDTHVCYAALPNNFVVRANGVLQKCTVALNDDRNTVGIIKEAGLTLTEQYSRWLSVWGHQDPKFLACPARAVLSSSTSN